ncbi:MAG: hypothetical protein IT430_09060 [Phycisphaerales bacterium]|nr:hypothetical protein [Phycisphaerales bacterium]
MAQIEIHDISRAGASAIALEVYSVGELRILLRKRGWTNVQLVRHHAGTHIHRECSVDDLTEDDFEWLAAAEPGDYRWIDCADPPGERWSPSERPMQNSIGRQASRRR